MFVHGLQCKMVSARTHHLNIHVGWNHFLVLWQRLELYFHVEHLACIFICAVYHILVNSGLWRDVFHETFKTNDNAIYKSYIFGPSNALCCDSLWFCVTMNPMQKSALSIVCMSPRFFAWAVLLHWLMAVAGQPVRQHSFMDFPEYWRVLEPVKVWAFCFAYHGPCYSSMVSRSNSIETSHLCPKGL